MVIAIMNILYLVKFLMDYESIWWEKLRWVAYQLMVEARDTETKKGCSESFFCGGGGGGVGQEEQVAKSSLIWPNEKRHVLYCSVVIGAFGMRDAL